MRLIGSVLVIALSLSATIALTIFSQPRPVSEYTCLQIGDQVIDLRTGAVSQGEAPLPIPRNEPHTLSDGRYFTFERVNALTDQDATLAHFHAADDRLIRTYRLPHPQGAPKPSYFGFVLAPNNRYLALWWMDNSSGFPIGQLVMLDLASEQVWEVTRRLPREGLSMLTWAVDSTRFYYFYLLDRGIELHVYDLITKQPEVLVRRIRSDRYRTLSLSPDRTKLLLGLEDTQPDRLVLITLNGSQAPLMLLTGFGGYRVAWADDGSLFGLFSRDRRGQAHTLLMRSDGQSVGKLTFDGEFHFSPSGRYLVYNQLAARTSNTYLYDIAGGTSARLVHGNVTRLLLWSPDDQWVSIMIHARDVASQSMTVFQVGSGQISPNMDALRPKLPGDWYGIAYTRCE